MLTNIKVGDTLECIDADHREWWTKGKQYEVVDISDGMARVNDDDGTLNNAPSFRPHHFKLLTPTTEEG